VRPREFAFVLALASAACVPPGPRDSERGAAGFTVEPSAVAKGTSFVTSDGWNVRIETLVVFMQVIVTQCATRQLDRGLFVWNGAAPANVFVRAIDVGSCTLAIGALPFGRFMIDEDGEGPPYEFLGVDAPLSARFTATTPALIVIARGERNGAVVTLDVDVPAFGVPQRKAGFDALPRATFDVRVDDLTLVPIDLVAERLFRVDPKAGVTSFSEIADADARGNRDGRVTAEELAAVEVACDACGDPGTRATLLERLSAQVNEMLVTR
jgi:hypothetical protein